MFYINIYIQNNSPSILAENQIIPDQTDDLDRIQIIPLDNQKQNNIQYNMYEKCYNLRFYLSYFLISVFSVIQIIYGFYYYDNITCNGGRARSDISTWLIVDGTILPILLTLFKITMLYKVTGFAFLIIGLSFFWVIWVTIGSAIFFTDCSSIKPKSINDIMLINLLLNYIILFLVCLLISPCDSSSIENFIDF